MTVDLLDPTPICDLSAGKDDRFAGCVRSRTGDDGDC
jgi:hypothetical protein